MNDPIAIARPEIRALQAYEHAAWDPSFERLHANELPWRTASDGSQAGLNRYPEPHPDTLGAALARLYDVPADHALVCRGSDEAIDLLVRGFCTAGRDAVLVCPPTFGMYAVAAQVQGAAVTSIPLRREAGYTLDVAAIAARCERGDVKLVFICTPNNPTGNALAAADILAVVERTAGRALVVVDEAYVEFAAVPSCAQLVERHPHVVVLRTLSKAHGLAGARIGTLIADPRIVALLRKVVPPYAIAQPCIEAAMQALAAPQLRLARERVAAVVRERARLAAALAALPGVLRVWPSDANFLLTEFHDPDAAIARFTAARLRVRDFRNRAGLGQALRITIGSPEQNDRLLRSLAC
ncbi:MAG: Histidinol-phosphate aminotransferase [Steroidobacteraceae bacterium]|nr:Histidinol-phosphate aminotransferase [Steroidobacteraceae bacterium]